MSFRLKTILGVALIEAVLLLMLVWSSLNYLEQSANDELRIRADTATRLVADLSRDAVLSTDLARLDSVASQVITSPEVVYLRIMDSRDVLVSRGEEAALARFFQSDSTVSRATDGVFDSAHDIVESGERYGRVELGLSVARAKQLFGDARSHLFGIAMIEMFLVALFSFVLGTYLTRGLQRLTNAADAVSEGELGTQVDVHGQDELAVAGRAFNTMSVRLAETHREMQGTVKKRDELLQRLAQQELRLKAILDTAVDGFITIDERGVIDDINPAGAALFGYEVKELLGRNVSCLMPEPYQGEHDGYLKDYLDSKVAKVIGVGREVVGLRRDGSAFEIDLAVSEIELNGEHLFVGLVRDISERRRIEAESRRNAAMKAAVVDANLDGLVTVDLEDRIVEFSPVAEAMFGYSREYAIGREMGRLLVPEHLREAHKAGMEQYRQTRNGPVLGQRIEIVAQRSNGEQFPIELAVQATEVNDESFFIAFIRDISERKAAEEQLTKAKRRAEEASEAKSRFLAHMSHEIRSPLNAVLGSVGLLLDDGLNSEQRLYAQTADTSGKTLLALINDILDFSKIEAGELHLDSTPFDLMDLLGEVADLSAFRLSGKHVQTAIALAPGIQCKVDGDSIRLRQILINLMDNALKYTAEGAVVLVVEPVAEDTKSVTLRFTVEDTGVGIPEEAQAGLFEEFRQVDSSDSTRFGGTGLGLSICEGLTRAMGGRIWLESQLGQGSCFHVEIALRKSQTSTQTEHDRTTQMERRVFNNEVLIVGLHPLIRKALHTHSRRPDRSAVMVDSVREALRHLDPAPAAILVDGTFPQDELERLAEAARGVGVAHQVLISPQMDALATGAVQDGRFDDLLLMPLLVNRVVDMLRKGPGKSPDVPLASQNVTGIDRSVAKTLAIRLLLAEDSPANQVVAKALLTKKGYQVDVVENGQEAVSAFESGAYDLILMDLRMPGMDGLEATRLIRAQETNSHIPIVAMTANARQEDVDRCLASGMDDFVAKPVDKQKLFAALERQLGATDSELARESNVLSVDQQPGTEAADKPLLDDSLVDALAEDTSPEAVPMMLRMFVDEVTLRAGKVRDGLDAPSLDGLEDEAHTLKSLAGTFGAIRLQGLARGLETACREGNRASAENLGKQLVDVVDDTLNAYRDRFDRLAESSE
jgi:PAS domain S-box-containing protein